MHKRLNKIVTQGMKFWKNVDFFTVCPLTIFNIEQQFRFSDVHENWKYICPFKKGIHPIVDGLC